MPEGYEYVLAAYGIWVLVFGLYVPLLKRRLRMLQKSIKAFRKRSVNDRETAT